MVPGHFLILLMNHMLLIAVHVPHVLSVPVHDFFPFGHQLDSEVPREDDSSSGKIEIAVMFPFYGNSNGSLFVNTNGGVSFGQELRTFTPSPFPLEDEIPLLAAYWADVDTRINGDIWYRESTERNVLDKATREIRCFGYAYRSFHADWVFIATWEEVSFYQHWPLDPHTQSGRDKRCTFQIVLAFDSARKIFILKKCQKIGK